MTVVCQACRCDLKKERLIYGCQCNRNVYFCFSCSRENQCYKCFNPLSMLKIQRCYECMNFAFPGYIFKDSNLYEYCIDCMRKFYQSHQNKSKVTLRRSFEVDKITVYAFLKCYCWKCKEKMQEEQKQLFAGSAVREILPLQNNICQQCERAQAQSPKQNHTKGIMNEEYKPPRRGNRFREPNFYTGNFPKCTACDGQVYTTGAVSDDYILCSLCARFSKIEEDHIMKQSLSKLSEMREEEPYLYDSYARYSSKQRDRSFSPPQQKRSNIYEEDHVKKNSEVSQKPSLKKSKSQEQLLKVQLEVKNLVNDKELIVCAECHYPVEELYSFLIEIEQNKIVSLCRGCYGIHTKTLQPSLDYRLRAKREQERERGVQKQESERPLRESSIIKKNEPKQTQSAISERLNEKYNGSLPKRNGRLVKKDSSAAENFPQILEDEYKEPSNSIYNSMVIPEEKIEDLLPQFKQQQQKINAHKENKSKSNQAKEKLGKQKANSNPRMKPQQKDLADTKHSETSSRTFSNVPIATPKKEEPAFLDVPLQKSNIYDDQSARRTSRRKEDPYEGTGLRGNSSNRKPQPESSQKKQFNNYFKDPKQFQEPYSHAGSYSQKASSPSYSSYLSKEEARDRKRVEEQNIYRKESSSSNSSNNTKFSTFNSTVRENQASCAFCDKLISSSDIACRVNDKVTCEKCRNFYYQRASQQSNLRSYCSQCQNPILCSGKIYEIESRPVCLSCFEKRKKMYGTPSIRCGQCHRKIENLNKTYEINSLQVCLECFGEYNIKMKRSKQKYFSVY